MMQTDLFTAEPEQHIRRMPYYGTTGRTLADAQAMDALKHWRTRYWIVWKDGNEKRVGLWFAPTEDEIYTLAGTIRGKQVKLDELAVGGLEMPKQRREASDAETRHAEAALSKIMRDAKGWISREGNSPEIWKLLHSGMCD